MGNGRWRGTGTAGGWLAIGLGLLPASWPEPKPEPPAEEKKEPVDPQKNLRLLHDDIVKQALDQFKKSIREAKNDFERANAIYRLSQRERDVAIIAQMPPFLTTGGNVNRVAAITLLTDYRLDPLAAQTLAAAIPANRARGPILAKLYDALGTIGHESAVPVLVERINAGDTRTAPAAAETLGQIKSAASIEALMKAFDRLERDNNKGQGLQKEAKKAFEDRQNAVAEAILGSLRILTGQLLSSRAEYDAWWSKNRETFKFKTEQGEGWSCPSHKLLRGGKS